MGVCSRPSKKGEITVNLSSDIARTPGKLAASVGHRAPPRVEPSCAVLAVWLRERPEPSLAAPSKPLATLA